MQEIWELNTQKGEIILFLDADIFLLNPKTLENAFRKLKNYEADVLLGKVRFPNTLLGVYLSRCFGDKFSMKWGEYTPHNGFMLVKKEALYDVGLYDENFRFGGEDADLLYRFHLAGKKVVYDPEIEVFHNAGYTVEEWKKKAYRDGYSAAKFKIKYGLKNGIITSKFYPFLASLYAGAYGLRKVGSRVLNYFSTITCLQKVGERVTWTD